MKHLLKTPLNKIVAAGLALTAFSQTAQAADPADCQVVIMQSMEVEDAGREAQIASFFPAKDFITSVKDDIQGHISEVNGQKIQALMCTRNEIIPAKSDYDVLATGIPFILSQDFDSQDTDSLTVKWLDEKFKYAYKGYPLSDEAETLLKTRLAKFSDRGLNDWAIQAAVQAEAEVTVAVDTETDPDTVNVVAADDSELQDLEDAAAEEILTGKAEISEATKLNVQTKN